MSNRNDLTTAAKLPATNSSLVRKFADRYSLDADKLLNILRSTAFRQRPGGVTITNEQLAALLVVADQYSLNPFTKEIFAFEDKGHIIPVVSVDGWLSMINDHPQLDGIEFKMSENLVTPPMGKECPDWCEAHIYRKDRSRPIIIREYIDEVYVGRRGNPPKDGPWQTHTKRMLRHKTLIQAARVAFSFSGIYDEDEAHRIIEGSAVRVTEPGAVGDLQRRLEEASGTPASGLPAGGIGPGDDFIDGDPSPGDTPAQPETGTSTATDNDGVDADGNIIWPV